MRTRCGGTRYFPCPFAVPGRSFALRSLLADRGTRLCPASSATGSAGQRGRSVSFYCTINDRLAGHPSSYCVIARSVATWQSVRLGKRIPTVTSFPRNDMRFRFLLKSTMIYHGRNDTEQGERCERCRWQRKRAERVAAVDRCQGVLSPKADVGHRNRKGSNDQHCTLHALSAGTARINDHLHSAHTKKMRAVARIFLFYSSSKAPV